MKKSTTLLLSSVAAALAASLACPSVAHAQVGMTRRFGLGLALGYPDVGISAQYYLTPTTSLQFALSFWYRDGRFGDTYVGSNSGAFIRGDYLFHPATLITGTTADLVFYVGPGIYMGFGTLDSFLLGLEAPVGLQIPFKTAPVDLAFEAVPRLSIADGSGVRLGLSVGGAFHVRYYF